MTDTFHPAPFFRAVNRYTKDSSMFTPRQLTEIASAMSQAEMDFPDHDVWFIDHEVQLHPKEGVEGIEAVLVRHAADRLWYVSSGSEIRLLTGPFGSLGGALTLVHSGHHKTVELMAINAECERLNSVRQERSA